MATLLPYIAFVFPIGFDNLGNNFNYLNVILNILNTYSVKVIRIFVVS